MINKAILVGRLGREPEYRASQSGKASCRFSLATDSGYGQSRKTEWHSIVCFDKQAEFARDYLHKGSLVYIEGRISYGEYEKDGVKASVVETTRPMPAVRSIRIVAILRRIRKIAIRKTAIRKTIIRH